MKLQQLHERFIEKAHRPMSFGSLPISPRAPDAPVIPVDRWREADGTLYKTYKFRRMHDRTDFVMQLLAYEDSIEHHAEIKIDGDTVELKVRTKDLHRVTELDKEYARYSDILFRGLVYCQRHADEI